MKNVKMTMIITGLVCLIPIIAGIILWDKMPDSIPIHWDAHGNVNGYGSKFTALLILPGSMFILDLLMPWLLKMDPKYKNMSPALVTISIWTIPVLSLLCSGLTLIAAMGIDVAIEIIIPAFVGVLFILIGNYLPKTKQSYTMGIKLPWTLDNEENWNKTHRLAGYIWVAGGIITVLSALFGMKMWLLIIVLAVMVFAPAIYSYTLYVKSKGENK